MRQSRLFVVAGSALLLAAASALSAQAQSCFRWTYPYVDPSPCLKPTGDNSCYWMSAQEACNSYIAEYQIGAGTAPWTAKPVVKTADPLIYGCYYTYIDQTTNAPTAPVYQGTVYAMEVPVAPFCQMPVTGPYANCSDGYWISITAIPNGQGGYNTIPGAGGIWSETRRAGAYYTPWQKTVIRTLNTLRTDTLPPPTPELQSDLAGLYPETNCPNGLIHPGDDPNDDCTAEVHHVVPRVEGKLSCPCGTSSYANALVISRKLNNTLGNKEPPAALLAALAQIPPYTCSDAITPRDGLRVPLDPADLAGLDDLPRFDPPDSELPLSPGFRLRKALEERGIRPPAGPPEPPRPRVRPGAAKRAP